MLPADFRLMANFPNPFNAQTAIVYQVPEATRVELTIFNLMGQQVSTLVNAVQSPAAYQVLWDGTDASGTAVGSGVYLYRMRAGTFQQTRSLLLLK